MYKICNDHYILTIKRNFFPSLWSVTITSSLLRPAASCEVMILQYLQFL